MRDALLRAPAASPTGGEWTAVREDLPGFGPTYVVQTLRGDREIATTAHGTAEDRANAALMSQSPAMRRCLDMVTALHCGPMLNVAAWRQEFPDVDPTTTAVCREIRRVLQAVDRAAQGGR